MALYYINKWFVANNFLQFLTSAGCFISSITAVIVVITHSCFLINTDILSLTENLVTCTRGPYNIAHIISYQYKIITNEVWIICDSIIKEIHMSFHIYRISCTTLKQWLHDMNMMSGQTWLFVLRFCKGNYK